MADDQYQCYADAANAAGLNLPRPDAGSLRVKQRDYAPGQGDDLGNTGTGVTLNYRSNGQPVIVDFDSSRKDTGTRTDALTVQQGYGDGITTSHVQEGNPPHVRSQGSPPPITNPAGTRDAVQRALSCGPPTS